MYPASEKFHKAVYENSPSTRILFSFPDSTILTNEDVLITKGLKFIEAANLEEELTIGTCPSSSIDVTIWNDRGLLSGYDFGECQVSIGARTDVVAGEPTNATVTTILRQDTDWPLKLTGHNAEPYLRINGQAPSAQPPFPVASIITVSDTVYCLNEEGDVWAAAWVDGKLWNSLASTTWDEMSTEVWDSIQGILVPLTDSEHWEDLSTKTWDELSTRFWNSFIVFLEFNDFMKNKFKGWAERNRGMSYSDGVLYEHKVDGTCERYEYVKLGTFRVNTPKKQKVDQIALTAYDRMTRFDVEADTFLDALGYPTTLGDIFAGLCEYVGVPAATTTFINSSRSFSERPLQTEGVTAKDVLGWIAEAACSFARMTRDGEVELAWFGEQPVTIPMNQYFKIDAAEYEVIPIDKLQILSSETDIGVIIGTGTNGYQIMDNPYLYGASNKEIRTYGVPVFNRLSAFGAFSPVTATAVCDWSIQAGDIISIDLNGITYTFPIYCQTITWKGNARVSYESTGAERRPVMEAVNRRLFAQKRAMHEIAVTVDGVYSRIEDVEGNINELEITAEGLSNRVTDAENNTSSLRQTVNSINLSVSNGYTSSTISLNVDGTTISSQTITMSGIVTFSSLSSPYATVIDGSNIMTGTVSANRIDVNGLYVKHLNGADGTFTGTLSGANGTFSGSLSSVTGSFTNLYGTQYINLANTMYIYPQYINAYGVQIGYISGYNDVCILPPYSNYGNIGVGARPWDQVVARLVHETSTMNDKMNIFDAVDEDVGNIENMKAVVYEIKGRPGVKHLGMIAEELAETNPIFVSFDEDGQPFAINYSRIAVFAIMAIQRLQSRIDRLEQQIQTN